MSSEERSRGDETEDCAHCGEPLGDNYTPFASHEGNRLAVWDDVAECWLLLLCAKCANDYDGDD